METFEQYFNEGKFTPYILGAAGLLAPKTDMNAAVQPAGVVSSTINAFNKSQFVEDWGTYYQTSRDPIKMKRAKLVISGRSIDDIPSDAMKAIEMAARIFEGDHGATYEEIKQYLIYTGFVESEYKHKAQLGGGPARSYWQVEPKTAYSLVHNSYQYLGTNFRRAFPDRINNKTGKKITALQKLQSLDLKEWSNALEQYTNLGAVMAAHKWISTKWKIQSKK